MDRFVNEKAIGLPASVRAITSAVETSSKAAAEGMKDFARGTSHLPLLHEVTANASGEASRLVGAIGSSLPNECLVKGKGVKGNEWSQSPPMSSCAGEMAVQKDALHRYRVYGETHQETTQSCDMGGWRQVVVLHAW